MGEREGEMMESYVIRPKFEIQLTNTDIDDIMCTSLEGGVTAYWCCLAEVVGDNYLGEYASEQISRGGKLEMYDRESDDSWVLDRDKFLNGVKLWLESGRGKLDENGRLDVCNIDAIDADIIVQLALFGDIVFG